MDYVRVREHLIPRARELRSIVNAGEARGGADGEGRRGRKEEGARVGRDVLQENGRRGELTPNRRRDFLRAIVNRAMIFGHFSARDDIDRRGHSDFPHSRKAQGLSKFYFRDLLR